MIIKWKYWGFDEEFSKYCVEIFTTSYWHIEKVNVWKYNAFKSRAISIVLHLVLCILSSSCYLAWNSVKCVCGTPTRLKLSSLNSIELGYDVRVRAILEGSRMLWSLAKNFKNVNFIFFSVNVAKNEAK